MGKVFSDQGFATRDTYTGNTKLGKSLDDALDFIKCQPVFRRLKLLEILRQAVKAAQVAFISN